MEVDDFKNGRFVDDDEEFKNTSVNSELKKYLRLYRTPASPAIKWACVSVFASY